MSEKNMSGFVDFYFVHGCVVVQAQKENILACSEGTEALFSRFLPFFNLLSLCLSLFLSHFYLCFLIVA